MGYIKEKELLKGIGIKLRVKNNMEFDVGMDKEERFLTEDEKVVYRHVLLLEDPKEWLVAKSLYLAEFPKTKEAVGYNLWKRKYEESVRLEKVNELEERVLKGIHKALNK